jgi:ADP-heptose:LPS heptosyltransferase
MVTGHVRNLQLKDPRKVKIVYERRTHWSPVFDHNPRIARIGEEGDFQLYYPRVNGLRPYCSGKSSKKWTWTEYKPPVGEIFLLDEEKEFGESGLVIIEPNTKEGASPNKDWGWDRWREFVVRLNKLGIDPVQLGPPKTNVVSGARLIVTETFRQACAVLSKARAAVLHEGALHHAAAVFGIPSIVIFGGYISPKQTGYDSQVNLFTGGEPCGMRLPCMHCQEAMAKIKPEQVLEELKALL